MEILLAASEAVPFSKTGGLADVVGALAGKLAHAGHGVRLFIPAYRRVEGHEAARISVPLAGQSLSVGLRRRKLDAAEVYFVDYPPFFERAGLYGQDGRDYPDNDRRFILFSRAVLEGAKKLGLKPDVFHLHDWQTALIAPYLQEEYRGDFPDAGSLLTIHNVAYQGAFPRESLAAAGFGDEHFTPERFEYYGKFNFLKAGLVSADILSTVSPTYAREIQESPERGFGLEGVLRRRNADLHGVINGLDEALWNPAADKSLSRRYSAGNSGQGKAACKKALQARCGLAQDRKLPLIGIVSRLDRQKGLDLALPLLRERLGRCQLAVLGSGDPALAAAFANLARENPQAAYFTDGFNEDLARQIYAGSDIFLMPSRFEPCGLGQMIAMRYGSIPVATRTGGLADTVFEDTGRANGFLAAPDSGRDLAGALDRALAAYGGPQWRPKARSAMENDFSWERSVARYVELYAQAKINHDA